MKLFTISLMVGAGSQLVMIWTQLAEDARFLDIVNTPMAIAGGALLFGIASWSIPSLAASMVSGAVGFGIQEAMGTTMMTSRLAFQSAAAPMALGSAAAAGAGVAIQSARNAGGGIGGAIRGLGTGAAAIGREARNAAVPTLGGAVRNLQKQRNDRKGEDE